MATKTESTLAPEKRDESTDTPVTELVEPGDMKGEDDFKAAAGIDGKVEDGSTQQQDVYHHLKQVAGKEDAPELHPFAAGPGSDIG